LVSREDLHKKKGASLLIAMFYIEIFSELMKHFDVGTVEQKLRQLGENIARSYYEYYQPKESSISGLVKEIASNIGGIKKFKLTRVEDGFIVSIFDCPLCLEEIEIEGPHYCISNMAILETLVNLTLQDRPHKFRYKQIIGDIISSKSSGAEKCVYHYRLVEK